jgi:hypothetical protein
VGMAACHFRWVTCRRKNVHSKYELYLLFIHELTRNAILKLNANLSGRTSKLAVRGPMPAVHSFENGGHTHMHNLLPTCAGRLATQLLRNYGSLCRVNWLTTWEGG